MTHTHTHTYRHRGGSQLKLTTSLGPRGTGVYRASSRYGHTTVNYYTQGGHKHTHTQTHNPIERFANKFCYLFSHFFFFWGCNSTNNRHVYFKKTGTGHVCVWIVAGRTTAFIQTYTYTHTHIHTDRRPESGCKGSAKNWRNPCAVSIQKPRTDDGRQLTLRRLKLPGYLQFFFVSLPLSLSFPSPSHPLQLMLWSPGRTNGDAKQLGRNPKEDKSTQRPFNGH